MNHMEWVLPLKIKTGIDLIHLITRYASGKNIGHFYCLIESALSGL